MKKKVQRIQMKMAGRAHQTLWFEYLEQRKILPISDNDVTKEYFAESGGREGDS